MGGITYPPAKKITWPPAQKVVHLAPRKKDHFHTATNDTREGVGGVGGGLRVGKVTTIQARGGGGGGEDNTRVVSRQEEDGGRGEPHEGKVREHLIYNLYCSYTQIATSTSQIEKSVGSTANHFQVATFE